MLFRTGRVLTPVALALLVLGSGCGKTASTVEGKVTLDGQPLDGTIHFVPKDGATNSAAGPIKAGAYNLEVPPGPKIVQVRATKVVGKHQAYKGDPKSPMVDDVREMVPAKYNASSVLTFTVAQGKNQHDLELKSKP